MVDGPTRRRLLAAASGGVASLAGCSGLLGGGNDDDTPDTGGGTPTDTATGPSSDGGGGLPASAVEPWRFIGNDAAESGSIDGSVPTSDLAVRWSAGPELINAPVVFPVFNSELVLLAFQRRQELQFYDHAGKLVAEQRMAPPREKYAQADGFVVESTGGRAVKFDNEGQQVWDRISGFSAQFEPHPEPDVLSYRRTTEDDAGATVGEVGVYDFGAEERRWRRRFPLERSHEGTNGPVAYRLSDLYIDGERGVLAVSVLLDENRDSAAARGELVGLDLAGGEDCWRLSGVNRLPGNVAGGNLLSSGVAWAGSESTTTNQYLRSYHVTALDDGADREVASMADDGDLFDDSRVDFDTGYRLLGEDALYATPPDRTTLVALDTAGGEQRWTLGPGAPVVCQPRRASNALVLGTEDGLAFVSPDGESFDRFALDTSFEGGIMLTPGRVYAAGDSLHAVERSG